MPTCSLQNNIFQETKPSLQWMIRQLVTYGRFRVYTTDFDWHSTLWHMVQEMAVVAPDLHVRLNAEQDPTWMEIYVVY